MALYDATTPPLKRPIVYGSTAALINKGDIVADPSHSHKWTVYLRGTFPEWIDDLQAWMEKTFPTLLIK